MYTKHKEYNISINIIKDVKKGKKVKIAHIVDKESPFIHRRIIKKFSFSLSIIPGKIGNLEHIHFNIRI